MINRRSSFRNFIFKLKVSTCLFSLCNFINASNSTLTQRKTKTLMKCVFIYVSGLKKLMKKEDTTVMDMLPIILAEAIGTAILVFIGCLGCVGSMGTSRTLMQISLAFGIAVMIAIQVRIALSLVSITIAVIILSVPPFSVRWSYQRCAY